MDSRFRNRKNTNPFVRGDWLTWKSDWTFLDLTKSQAIGSYGEGPFEVIDVRGEMLTIKQYRGSSKTTITNISSRLFEKTNRLCSQCGINPVHYNLSVCYNCEYYD